MNRVKNTLLVVAGLLLFGFATISGIANQRKEESGTVTNGVFTFTVDADYAQGYLRQVLITYAAAATETVRVDRIVGNVTNNLLTTNMASTATLLWLPAQYPNLGATGDVWSVTCPSSTTNPATVRIPIQDHQ